MSAQAKSFRVATFCDSGETRMSKVHCYSKVYNPAWDGCVIYEVQASSGREARKKAARMRIEQEASK